MLEETSAMSRGGIRKTVVISGRHVGVDVAHHPLVFVIMRRADPAQHVFRALFFRVIHQVAVVEMSDDQALAGHGDGVQQLQAFRHGERITFRGIVADGHDQAVEHFQSALDHPQVTVGGWVE